MMLCGIKLRLDSTHISKLLKNPDIEFKSLVNLETSEVDPTRLWSKDKMNILIKSSGYGHINGSLHIFKNGGRHNHDHFNWNQVFQTIDELSDALSLNVWQLHLMNLEWGINVSLDSNPKNIISGLVMHKGKEFKNMYVSPGTHSVCCHEQFSIKVYDKGSQHRLPYNILRIELAANKSAFFNNLGVRILDDIRNSDSRGNLQNSLLYGGWNDSILIEPGLMQFVPNSKQDYQRLSKWSNPKYWLDISNRSRCYQKKEYDLFRHKYGFTTKEKIFSSMVQIIREL